MNKLFGILIVTLSTFGYAALFPLSKKANEKLPPFTLMTLWMFFLLVCCVLASLLFEKGALFKVSSYKTLLPMFILMGIANFVAFWLEIVGYKYMPLWQQTMFSLLIPIFAGVLAFFILREQLSGKLFIGLVFMALGLFIAVR